MVGVSKYLNKMLLFLVDVKFVPWTYGRGGGGGSGFFLRFWAPKNGQKHQKIKNSYLFLDISVKMTQANF